MIICIQGSKSPTIGQEQRNGQKTMEQHEAVFGNLCVLVSVRGGSTLSNGKGRCWSTRENASASVTDKSSTDLPPPVGFVDRAL